MDFEDSKTVMHGDARLFESEPELLNNPMFGSVFMRSNSTSPVDEMSTPSDEELWQSLQEAFTDRKMIGFESDAIF